jgi:hypothetical protein
LDIQLTITYDSSASVAAAVAIQSQMHPLSYIDIPLCKSGERMGLISGSADAPKKNA